MILASDQTPLLANNLHLSPFFGLLSYVPIRSVTETMASKAGTAQVARIVGPLLTLTVSSSTAPGSAVVGMMLEDL